MYYSLYSINPEFRKRWLPKAIPPTNALHILRRWQDETGGEVKIHFALIKGENDGLDDISRLVDLVHNSGLRTSFNLVRYNPPNEKSQETSEQRLNLIGDSLISQFPGSQIVARVGTDVFASCGTFFNGE